MKNIARFMLLPLILLAIIFIKPSFSFWNQSITPTMFASSGSVLIGTWVMPLDTEYEYEEGDMFLYDDQVWEVVDTNIQPEDDETRMMVIIPGEGLVLVAITGDGNGKTIVVRL